METIKNLAYFLGLIGIIILLLSLFGCQEIEEPQPIQPTMYTYQIDAVSTVSSYEGVYFSNGDSLITPTPEHFNKFNGFPMRFEHKNPRLFIYVKSKGECWVGSTGYGWTAEVNLHTRVKIY